MSYDKLVEDNVNLIHLIVNKFSKKLCNSVIDREDLFQEALTVLYEKRSKYNCDYAPTTFITMILNNHFINMIENKKAMKNSNHLKNGDKTVRVKDTKNFNFNYLIDKNDLTKKECEALLTFYSLLENEDERTKEIVTLNKIEGVTIREIAKQQQISFQRVSQIINTFLKKVRGEIK